MKWDDCYFVEISLGLLTKTSQEVVEGGGVRVFRF